MIYILTYHLVQNLSLFFLTLALFCVKSWRQYIHLLQWSSLSINEMRISHTSSDKTLLHQPVRRSFDIAYKFHLGTVFFGSLILTLVHIVRTMIKRLTKNRLTQACVNYCFRSILDLLQFLNQNAYIVTGKSAYAENQFHIYIIWKSYLLKLLSHFLQPCMASPSWSLAKGQPSFLQPIFRTSWYLTLSSHSRWARSYCSSPWFPYCYPYCSSLGWVPKRRIIAKPKIKWDHNSCRGQKWRENALNNYLVPTWYILWNKSFYSFIPNMYLFWFQKVILTNLIIPIVFYILFIFPVFCYLFCFTRDKTERTVFLFWFMDSRFKTECLFPFT